MPTHPDPHRRLIRLAASADDQAFLFDLFCESKGSEFFPLGLPDDALRNLLSLQFRGREAQYSTTFPEARQEIVFDGDSRIGAIWWDDGDPLHILDVAVLACYQGEGFGTQILRDMMEIAGSRSIELSVALDNPASALYTRLGFVPAPDDDGVRVVMKWHPDSP